MLVVHLALESGRKVDFPMPKLRILNDHTNIDKFILLTISFYPPMIRHQDSHLQDFVVFLWHRSIHFFNEKNYEQHLKL